jgi:hypothetical protein
MNSTAVAGDSLLCPFRTCDTSIVPFHIELSSEVVDDHLEQVSVHSWFHDIGSKLGQCPINTFLIEAAILTETINPGSRV